MIIRALARLLPISCLFLCLLALQVGSVNAQAEPGAPPPIEVSKTVSPSAVWPGSPAKYEIIMVNPASQAYTGTVVLSDTLDVRLILQPATRRAENATGTAIGAFDDPGPNNDLVIWRHTILPGDVVTVSFSVTTSAAISMQQVIENVAYLYTDNASEAVSATVPLTVTPASLSLPLIATALLPLPELVNDDFEAGPEIGWSESPERLIYRYAEVPLRAPGGDPTNVFMAWLGGVRNQTNVLAQTVILPRGYESAGLRYRYWAASQETTCGIDRATLVAEAGGTSELVEIELCVAADTQAPGQPDGWTTGFVDLINLLGRVAVQPGGTPLTVTFRSVLNDNDRNSNLWLDDIFLCSDQSDAVGTVRCTP